MPHIHKIVFASLTLVVLALSSITTARADELIINGGFETGNFTGWTTTVRPASFGNLFVRSGTTTPLSGISTVGPASGTFYALTDQTGPGTYALIQPFTVAGSASSVVLTFDMFVNNYANTIVNPIGLDHTAGANQHARVDILSASASPFDTGAGVLRNLFLGATPGINPHPYIRYTFDITSLVGAGGTFQLRFAEVDNQGFFNLGVDNVSINATFGTTPIPEPTTMILLGTGLAGIAAKVRRGRKHANTKDA